MIPFIRTAVLVVCIGICGCSKGNDSAINVGVSGNHPAGWAVTSNGGNHPAMFLSAPDKCKECHGTDLRGGITKVDCFGSCHAQGPYGHAPGWGSAAAHGTRAKATVAGVDGMAFCANCHGTDFAGGTTGTSCFACHNTSPHAIPWLRSTGATTYLHSTASYTNASTCGGCHTAGAKLSIPATPPANAGCFNNTLCHGVMGHASRYPGATHKSDALTGDSLAFNCIPCHELTNATGTYPATIGFAPACTGCHSGWNTGNTGCGACHGNVSIADGRPNGLSFPNNAGRHASPDWHAVDCIVCHTGGGTGAISHGNSDRIIKTRADVTIGFTNRTGAAILQGMQFTRSNGAVTCTGQCHSKKNGGRTGIHSISTEAW